MQADISSHQLFARLAAGHAAGVTVVTPNRRLAAALMAEFDACQGGRGLAAWEAADILPLASFVERLWDEALTAEDTGERPVLLSAAQERERWQAILGDSGLLAVAQAAAQCREAWALAHAWRVKLGGGGEDTAAFAEWARRYERATGGELDAARLPDRIASLLARGALRKPKALVAYAFDILPPQSMALFDAFAEVGTQVLRCEPPARESRALRAVFPSATEEIEAAACWARARLEAGSRRIGIVVPDLAQRRPQVKRVFARVLGAEDACNLSLGEALSGTPLVAAALRVLRACAEDLPAAQASALIRSPFLAGAEREMSGRARLDVELRKALRGPVTLAKLVALSESCPLLRRALERLFACVREQFSGARSPHEWARRFSAALDAAGFPGERTLDSEEYQARVKWHETLGEFTRLARVVPSMPARQALGMLARLASETVFQAESPEAPVQVLGVLESAGLRFEHLWVSGLTDEAWPLDTRPNPFLSVRAQAEAGVPQASAQTSIALDRRLTEQWRRAADEVIFSHALKEGDRDLSPSPLIAAIPPGKVEVPMYPRHRDVLFAARRVEACADEAAPPYAEKRARGGTRVLADQAACPFRAFALHRLAAEPIEAPSQAPDAAARGTLLHELMKELWSALKGSQALAGDLAPTIAQAARAAVATCALEGRFAEIERARLEKLAREWLEIERQRPAFEVTAIEEKRLLSAGGLEFAGRVDRMDRLADGSHALIDYKTGNRLTPQHWIGARPDDPQLPLYAVSASEDVSAVAFAKVRAGSMRFMGFSRSDGALPGVKLYHDWQGLMHGWNAELERLAREFGAGEARVAPKRGLQTCQRCALQTLCRVYERCNALAEDAQAGE